MDRVFVRGLTATTIVGVYDWEQETPRRVILHLEMATDVAAAAVSDSIDTTVSYGAVARRLVEFLGSSRTRLVETLAERLAEVVLREFPVTWVKLELHKPGAVPEAETVGVIIERGTHSA